MHLIMVQTISCKENIPIELVPSTQFIGSVCGLFGCWDLQIDALLMVEKAEMFHFSDVPERVEEPGVSEINRRKDDVGF